ncbi:Protein CARMIL, partial [Diplonema papillatum]
MDSDTPNADAVGCYVRLCRELGVECCLEVLAALTTPSRACSLTDRATPLRDADVKAVAGMLRQHDAFDILNIEGNEVEQDGILSIANMLKRNTSLHTLRMAANLFRDGGVITLSHALLGNSALTSLDVSHNRIGGVACKALARVLQQQRGGAPGLEELVLHGNVIDAAAISHVTHALAGNTTLRHLHLGFNDLAGRGAAAVAGLFEAGSALRTVDLSNNRITDAEAASLFGAMARGGSGCALERLNVRSNLLGEKSFAALAGLLRGRTALREVFAGYNKPGPVAVATLLEAAARCTTLATLDVHGCTIPGAACLGRLLCGVGWPRAVRTDAGGSPLRSPVASAAFSCLLLDGVSCTSDADLLEQTRVWAGIRSTRLGVEERFQHVKKVFVGKETDRAACADDDDNDGTGGGGGRLSPAFFVGDLEKLRETTAATFSQAAADAQHGSWRQESVASHVEIAGPVGPEGSPPTARVRAAGGSVQAEAAAWPRSVRLSGDRPPPQASLAEVLERELAAERAEHRRKVSDLRAKLHALEAEEDEAEGVRVVGDVMRFLGAAAGGSVPRRGGLYKPWPTPMPPAEPAPQTSQSHQLHCGNRTSNPEQYNTAGKPGEEGRGLLENQASAGPPQPDSRQLSPPRPPPAAAARGFEPRRDGREHRCLSPPAPAGAGKPAAATVALAWGSLPAGSGAARRPPASGFEPSAFRQ